MAIFKLSKKSVILQTSHKQLNLITDSAYNSNIRTVAMSTWKKHLNPDNPQWKFLTIKSFTKAGNSGSAHVMAMVDKRLPGKGIVGYFACTNSEVGAEVLILACDWLKTTHGIPDIYGPINGTLPNDYRLNLNEDYIFPGEPVNPSWHIDAFRKAGFNVFNRYASGKLKHFNFWLKTPLGNPPRTAKHLKVRPFNNVNYDADFKMYHDLRNLIFPFQSIYCPAISLEERIYNSSGKFDPGYTYFLTDKDREIGFIMAYTYKKQLVLKTIGLLPDYRGKQLSGLLLKPVHEQAANEGITTAIYGMVREGNKVHNNKHPMAKVFRKYVTMHKSL